LILHPSDGASVDPAVPFTVYACPGPIPDDPNFEYVLDSNDGDQTFVVRCCTAPLKQMYVNMDDPDPDGVLKDATIVGFTVNAYVKYGAPGCFPGTESWRIDLGFKVTSGEHAGMEMWKGNIWVPNTGGYSLISYSYRGEMDLDLINNLQIYIKRTAGGFALLRITEIYAEIEYIP
jgi:hypothetical protein